MAGMTVLEMLEKGRELISSEEHWTTEFFARDREGQPRMSRDADAVRWCSTGALLHFWWNGEEARGQIIDRAEDLLEEVMGTHIPIFNDTHSHKEVLAKWDEAIALAKAREEERKGTLNVRHVP